MLRSIFWDYIISPLTIFPEIKWNVLPTNLTSEYDHSGLMSTIVVFSATPMSPPLWWLWSKSSVRSPKMSNASRLTKTSSAEGDIGSKSPSPLSPIPILADRVCWISSCDISKVRSWCSWCGVVPVAPSPGETPTWFTWFCGLELFVFPPELGGWWTVCWCCGCGGCCRRWFCTECGRGWALWCGVVATAVAKWPCPWEWWWISRVWPEEVLGGRWTTPEASFAFWTSIKVGVGSGVELPLRKMTDTHQCLTWIRNLTKILDLLEIMNRCQRGSMSSLNTRRMVLSNTSSSPRAGHGGLTIKNDKSTGSLKLTEIK